MLFSLPFLISKISSISYFRIILDRYYNFGHGIGKSGNLTERQPKALGSSLLLKISNELCLDAIRITLPHISSCFITPFATGMSLLLCLLTLKSSKPLAEYVIWPRVDQKSSFKAILMANLKPIIIENLVEVFLYSIHSYTYFPH